MDSSPVSCQLLGDLPTSPSTHNVSIALLRVLEYFEGVIFLTSNRVSEIDHAFQSRIHLVVAYPTLSADARKAMWKDWIMRANSGREPDRLTREAMGELVRKNVNGRETKNIMRTAHCLARSEKRDSNSVTSC